jgi:TnpA family transposase
VFYGKRGELHQAYREGQEDQLSALGLVVNAIVLRAFCNVTIKRPSEGKSRGRW